MGRLVLVVLIALGATLAGAQRYSVPRTPWGDPDLQGSFTNSNEYATPLERPDRFAGRRLEDLTDAEIVSVRREASQQAIDGLAPGPRGPDYWWLENLRLERRRQAWSVIDPPDGRIPPLTDAGRRRATGPSRQKTSFQGGPFDTPDDLGLLERCISRGVPGSMIPVMYGNTYDIVQTPGAVAITYEIIHETRVIPLDGRPHLHPGLRTYMGDARGRWEGDTLVVETTGSRDEGWLDIIGSPLTDAATITERIRRPTYGHMTIDVTTTDPKVYTKPWTVRVNQRIMPESELIEFICEENQRFGKQPQ
jgi:hypothetical protein